MKREILEYHKRWRDNNIEKINQKQICYCGGIYTYTHKSRHNKTKKHQRFLDRELDLSE